MPSRRSQKRCYTNPKQFTGHDVDIDRMVLATNRTYNKHWTTSANLLVRNAAGVTVWQIELHAVRTIYSLPVCASTNGKTDVDILPEVPPLWDLAARYVRLTRTDGDLPVHLNAMHVFCGATRHQPHTGTVQPPNSLPGFGWENLQVVDEKSTTNAGGNGGFIEIDLRSDRPIDRILLVNRKDCCAEMIVGTTLSIRTESGRMDWTMRITTIKESYNILVAPESNNSTDVTNGYWW